MSLVDELHTHVRLQTQLLGDVTPTGFPSQLATLDPFFETHEATVARIERDLNNSAIGRQNKRQEITATTRAETTQWGIGKIGGIDAQLAAIGADVAARYGASVTPPDPLAVQVMGEQLRGVSDTLEGDSVYLGASEPERRVMEAAVARIGRVVRKAPDGTMRLAHLISPERIAATQQARLDAFDPAAAEQRATLARIRRVYEAHVGFALALLEAQ